MTRILLKFFALVAVSCMTVNAGSSNLTEARKLFYLAHGMPKSKERREIQKKGKALSEDVLNQNYDNPEALYWWVAHRGGLAETDDLISAMKAAKEIEKKLLHLRKIAPEYEHGAADRVLSHLYFAAPSIISVGSREKARAHLEEAFRIDPNYPPNILAMAKHKLEQDEPKVALKLASAAITSPVLAQNPEDAPYWKKEAEVLIRKAHDEMPGDHN